MLSAAKHLPERQRHPRQSRKMLRCAQHDSLGDVETPRSFADQGASGLVKIAGAVGYATTRGAESYSAEFSDSRSSLSARAWSCDTRDSDTPSSSAIVRMLRPC